MASPSPAPATGGPPSPGVPAPVARCVARPSGGPTVLLGQAIYDVTDAVRPHLLCQVTNTVAHLYTEDTFAYIRPSGGAGTEVVLHSMGSGHESVIAGWPIKLLGTPFGNVAAWTVDGNSAATAVTATDAAGNQSIQIWLFTQPTTGMLYQFPQPLTDCICLFGLPPPILAFSADGQYLVSGWPIGKGATPIEVFRIADRSLVQTLDPLVFAAIWSRSGHELYFTSNSGAQSWSPEKGIAPLRNASPWSYEPGLSPDGSAVAFTAFNDPDDMREVRAFVYDFAKGETSQLTNLERSGVTFVKPGWVWYQEEVSCAGQADCPPWGIKPTGNVIAMDLSTRVEAAVLFPAGESPGELQSGW